MITAAARRAASAALAVLCLLLAPGAASASTGMESMFQDDNLLVYATPTQAARTIDTLHALGVDRLRLSVFWNVVAPQALSRSRPSFDASDPGAYPPGAWDRYDRLVELARLRGMTVNFDITSPAPFWATGLPARRDIEKDYSPSSREFGLFVRAVGTRYSGGYVPASPAASGPGAPSPGQALPRVDNWAIWNEPNQAGWLTPQWVPDPDRHGRFIERSPRQYRGLFDAAYASLQASGHGADTILVGETAPKGLNVQGITRSIKALHFIRLLYCVNDRYRPLRGHAAAAQACPTTAAASRGFAAVHPGLFEATGFAHHPYELTFAPDRPPADADFATIANLPRLSAALARMLLVYHVHRPGGLPLYLTEFGYQTNPPDPLGVTLAQQAAYLDQAEFIAYSNPSVRTLSQFLLVDDRPKPGAANRIAAYGATFQSGLEFVSGQRKPSFASYRMPIFIPIPRARRGHSVRVWGMARGAPHDGQLNVLVQFRGSRGRGGWRTLARRVADATHGFLDARVRIPASGSVRLSWSRGQGSQGTLYSRSVGVRLGR